MAGLSGGGVFLSPTTRAVAERALAIVARTPSQLRILAFHLTQEEFDHIAWFGEGGWTHGDPRGCLLLGTPIRIVQAPPA